MKYKEILEQYLRDKRADDGLLTEVSKLDLETQENLGELAVALGISANTLREYLRLLKECAQRDSRPILSYLASDKVKEILNLKLSKKEKQKLLRQHFEALRYPQREKLENNVKEIKNFLSRKYGLEIKVPEELEGIKIEFSFSAQSTLEIKERAQVISSLAEDPQLEVLFSLLLGNFEECK